MEFSRPGQKLSRLWSAVFFALTILGMTCPAEADSFTVRAPARWQKLTTQQDGDTEITLYADQKSSRHEMIVLQSEPISEPSAREHENIVEKRREFSETRSELFALSGLNGYAVTDMHAARKKPRTMQSLVVIQSRYLDFTGREVQTLERQYVARDRLLTVTYLLQAPALNDRGAAERILDFFEPHAPSRRGPASVNETKSGSPSESAVGGAFSSAEGGKPFQMMDPKVQARCQEFCKKDPTRCQIKNDPGFQQTFASLQTGWGCFAGLKDGLLNLFQVLIWNPLKFGVNYGKSWLTDGKYKEQVHAGVGTVVAEAWKSPSAFAAKIASTLWSSAGQALGDWFYCANSKEQVRQVCSFATNFIPLGLLWKMITKTKMTAAEVAEVNAAFRKGAETGPKLSADDVAALKRPATEVVRERIERSPEAGTAPAPESARPAGEASVRGREAPATNADVRPQSAMVKQYYALLSDEKKAELDAVLKRGGLRMQDDFEKLISRGRGYRVREVLEGKHFAQSREQRQAALATLIRDLAAGEPTASIKPSAKRSSIEIGRERWLEGSAVPLTTEARIVEAQKVLGRTLSPTEQAAILDAHEVGAGAVGADKKTLARIGNYSVPQLKEKAEILRKAGFNENQRRKLMENGIVGEDARLDMNVVKHRNNEWAVELPEPPTAVEKAQSWAKGGEWRYFTRKGGREIEVGYFKEGYQALDDSDLKAGDLPRIITIPDSWVDRSGKPLNLKSSEVASQRNVHEALAKREQHESADEDLQRLLNRIATNKYHPLVSGNGFSIVSDNKRLQAVAETLHQELIDFDSYLKAMGFKIPRETRVILDESGPQMGPFAYPAPIYSTRESKLYSRTIAMNPLGDFTSIVKNHSAALHERVHTVLFSTYSNEARINSHRLVAFQEAIADFLTLNYLGTPKLGRDVIFPGTTLRNLEKRLSMEGTGSEQRLVTALDLGSEPHHDSHVYSNTLWRMREVLGREKMDALVKAFIDDLNHHADHASVLQTTKGSNLLPRTGPAFQMEAEDLAYFLASLRRTAESKDIATPVNKVIKEVADSFLINPKRIDEYALNMKPTGNYERKGKELRAIMEVNTYVLKDQLKHAGIAAGAMGTGGAVVIYEIESSPKK